MTKLWKTTLAAFRTARLGYRLKTAAKWKRVKIQAGHCCVPSWEANHCLGHHNSAHKWTKVQHCSLSRVRSTWASKHRCFQQQSSANLHRRCLLWAFYRLPQFSVQTVPPWNQQAVLEETLRPWYYSFPSISSVAGIALSLCQATCYVNDRIATPSNCDAQSRLAVILSCGGMSSHPRSPPPPSLESIRLLRRVAQVPFVYVSLKDERAAAVLNRGWWTAHNSDTRALLNLRRNIQSCGSYCSWRRSWEGMERGMNEARGKRKAWLTGMSAGRRKTRRSFIEEERILIKKAGMWLVRRVLASQWDTLRSFLKFTSSDVIRGGETITVMSNFTSAPC